MPPLHLPAPIQLKSRCLPHVNSTRRLIVPAEGIGPSVVLQHGGNTPHLVVMALNSPPPVVLNDLVFLFRFFFVSFSFFLLCGSRKCLLLVLIPESCPSGVTFDCVWLLAESPLPPYLNWTVNEWKRASLSKVSSCSNTWYTDQSGIHCQRFQLLSCLTLNHYMVHQQMLIWFELTLPLGNNTTDTLCENHSSHFAVATLV